jgi:ankyrin repeat protein
MAFNRFRWVFCQLEALRNCLPQNVRRVLRELPNSLDETYERILREILKANPEQAYRLLQCLTVATRPLCVDELAEILALDFDGGKEGIPALNKDWRWGDEEQGILSTCSSLIVVVDGYVGSSKTRVVQFAHFSVKEFLTSDRLSDIKADISCFHIRPEPAHTIIAQACLAILLQLDCNDKTKSGSPLSRYAARHWVDHAQFGSVSLRVEDGTRLLFDPAKPYFTAWLNSYNLDHKWRSFPQGDIGAPIRLTSTFTSSGEADAPLCLYYAALCGFYDVTKDLIAIHPQHVNARVGLNWSPLVAALCNRHIHVAELLRQHGAVLHTSYGGRTLLHAASKDGMMNVVRWLLNIGVDANAQQDDHRTPLHLAAANGQLEIVQTLLGHGADANAAASWNNRTPLHEAFLGGHVDIVRLLSQNGAAASTDLQGLLHSASLLRTRSAETVQLFIQLGVDINAHDGNHETPLHLASSAGNAETVRLLIKHGLDVNARDGSQSMPLHLALSKGHDETVRMLIQNGADINARDGSQKTPLHQALSRGCTGTVLLLIDHGAYVNTLDGSHSTPLHLASSRRDAEVVQILVQNGADVNARDGNDSTPLHLASLEGNCDTVRILIEHGADVHALDQSQSTPLHNASSLSSWSNAETNVRLLIKHGANVNAYDRNHQTPLHLVSSSWSPNINSLCLLLENGANVDVEDDEGLTPFQIALSEGNEQTAQLLLDHRK